MSKGKLKSVKEAAADEAWTVAESPVIDPEVIADDSGGAEEQPAASGTFSEKLSLEHVAATGLLGRLEKLTVEPGWSAELAHAITKAADLVAWLKRATWRAEKEGR